MRITLLSASLLTSCIASAATPIDGWYTSVFGGYTFIPGNVENFFLGHFIHNSSFKGGYNVGGRIGFKSNPLRYEGEYTYLYGSTKAFKINHIPQTGVYGYSSGNLVMANIYYDTPDMLPAIAPYLGFGIGYAYIQESLKSTGPFAPRVFNMTNSSFAYQGTVGLTYNFAENYAVNVAYRYVATSSSNSFGSVYQAHIANAGAVYRFDNGNYK
jgi:opacity protein-like surface antigen